MTTDESMIAIQGLLGGSVIYEECKGNLTTARRLSDQYLERARHSKNPSQLADALLTCGSVHLLQGEPPAAQACFKQIEQLVPSDPERQLRVVAYSNLAAQLYFNTFPNWKSANGAEFQDRQDEFMAQGLELEQRGANLVKRVTNAATRLEAQVIALLCKIPTSRWFLDNLGMEAQEQGMRFMQASLQPFLDFRQQAAMQGVEPGLLAYVDLIAAGLYQRAGQYTIAQQFLNEAYAFYLQDNDLAGAAVCLMTRGDWLSAPSSTPLVWNFTLQDSGQQSSGLAWTLEAKEDWREGMNVEAAQAAYRDAENLFNQASAPRGLAAVQLRFGYLAHLTDDYMLAANHAKQAQAGFEASGDYLGYWLARAHYALSRIEAGQFPEERDTAQAIGTWGATEGSFSFALGLGLLFARSGRHRLIRVGDYEGALACYRLAQALYDKLGATTNVSQTLVDQGMIYRMVGDYNMALTFYEPALKGYEQGANTRPRIAEQLRTRALLLTSDINQLYLDKWDPDGMERTAQRVQQQMDQLSHDYAESPDTAAGKDTWFLGSILSTLLPFGRSVVEDAAVLVPLYRAILAREDGFEVEAEQRFAEALAAAQKAGDDRRDFLVAEVLRRQKKYEEAAKAFQQYVQRGGANAGLAGPAAAFLASSGAAGQAEERMQTQRTHEQAVLFFLQVKAYSEVLSQLEQLEQLAGPDWWTRDEHPWEALSEYGDVYAGLGKLEQAMSFYERAVSILEQRRTRLTYDELKTALAGERGPRYLYFCAARTAVDLLLEAERSGNRERAGHYAAQAFGYAERGKARGVLDLMYSNVALAKFTDTESKSLRSWQQATARLTAWRSLLASQLANQSPDPKVIAYLNQKIEAIEADLRRAETALAASHSRFYQLVNPQAPILSLERVSAMLPPDTAMLYYYFMGEDLLAWAITRQGLAQSYRAQVDVKALERHFRGFHQACQGRGKLDELGTQLAEALLKPLGLAIRSNTQLIVVPHGTAHLLPFHVLPWEGQPLIATHTVSYLPSASALQFLPAHGISPSERLLAVGNPAHMAYRPPLGGEPVRQQDLPSSKIEATYVASLFSQSTLLCDSAATKAAVVDAISGYPQLHFATHGFLSAEAPLLSAILLAEGEALHLYELLGLEFNASLVVLSACETGVGETTGGDDVLSLTRGLLGAGAHAAVVSLWPVNDVSTSMLLGRFYQCLRTGDPPALALQTAQNGLRTLSPGAIKEELDKLQVELGKDRPDGEEMRLLREATRQLKIYINGQVTASTPGLEDFSHPFYWAPFILVGGPLPTGVSSSAGVSSKTSQV